MYMIISFEARNYENGIFSVKCRFFETVKYRESATKECYLN